MGPISLVFQILLLVFGLFLVIAVLMQHGKSYGLSGTITGGAETFFGKEKGARFDKLLSRLTTVIGIIFVVIVLAVFVLQKDYKYSNDFTGWFGAMSPYYPSTEETTAPETTQPAETTPPAANPAQ